MSEETITPTKPRWTMLVIFLLLGTCLILYAIFTSQNETSRRTSAPAAAPAAITVKYELTGTVYRVSLTLENDTNGMEQGDFNIPYEHTWKNFEHGDFVYISAQALTNGKLTCQIKVNNTIIASATSNGKYQIATCSANIGE